MNAKPVIVALAAAAVVIASAASCTTLPALSSGCGNKVIDDGEDCDGNYEASANKCIEPGQPSQCHWACDDTTKCPDSFTCGADRVCRRPAGTFTQSIAVKGENSRRVMLGDFDGDGAKDVVAVGATSRVHFFDKHATTMQTLLSSDGELPSLGQVTTDGRASGILTNTFAPDQQPVQGSVRVWRGSADRTLLPTVYPNIDLTSSNVTAGHAISVIRDVNAVGSDVFALLTMGTQTALYDVTGTQAFTQPIRTSKVVGAVGPIHGRIPVGGLGSAACPTLGAFNYCQAIVLAFDGATSVSIHSTCDTTLAVNDVSMGTWVPPLPFTLPNGDSVGGSAFLVYPPTSTDPPSLYVQGKNAVYVFPPDANSCLLQTTGSVVPSLPGSTTNTILAIGFIEDTSYPIYPDWVDVDGIHINYGSGVFKTPPPATTKWTDAIIGDLNLNGLPDVVALSDGAVDFYNGTGSALLNDKHFSLDGKASNMAIGDFDGDFVSDIAFSTSGDSTGLSTDSINVAFGTFTGFPAQPVSVGRLTAVQQLEPTLFDYRIAGTPDFISTLFAIGQDSVNHLVVSILQGNSDRLINSPYFLAPSLLASLVSTAVADFDGSGHQGLAGLAQSYSDGAAGLWFTPMTGDAQVDLVNTSALTALPSNVNLTLESTRGYDRAGIAAVDVGSDPGDELLIVEPGHFFLTHVKKWPVLAFEAPTDLFALPDKDVVTRVADVDDDGDKDVIVEYSSTGGTPTFAAKIVLNGMNGTLSFASAISLDLPPGTIAVTTVHASRDGKTQVAAVAQSGVYLAQMSGGTLGPWSATPVFDLSKVSQVHDAIAGDVDGDGVDDIVIATSTGFFVCFGDEATQ